MSTLDAMRPPCERWSFQSGDGFRSVLEQAVGPSMDIYRRLWGKRRELSDVVFKTVSVPFVDFNNEIEGADTIQSQVAEAVKEFTVLELGYDFAVFCQDPGMTTLLVREEYELVVKAIGYNRESGAGCGGMQVTGDRGIGKKFCLIYLLVKRLLDQEPTFYQVEHDSAFLFCSQGVFSFRPSDFSGGRLKLACTSLGLTLSLEEGPLLLIGSSSSLSSLPSLFCRGYQSIFVVQAASPAPGGTAWLRESRAVRHVMNPWTWSEVVAGNSLQRSPRDIAFLREVFAAVGPSACLCCNIGDNRALLYELHDIEISCKRLSLDTILAHNMTGELIDARAKITSLWSRDERRHDYLYEFVSPDVARTCCEMWGADLDAETRYWFSFFTSSSQRIAASFLFEELAHKALSGSVGGVQLPNISRQLRSLRRGPLFAFGHPADDVKFHPPSGFGVQRFSFGVDIVAVVPGTYYRSKCPNHARPDSFFVDNDGGLTLFKMSIAERCFISAKELQALGDCLPIDARKNTKWRLIFVIPEGREEMFEGRTDTEDWAQKVEVCVLPLHLNRTQQVVMDELSEGKSIHDMPLD